AEMRCPLAVRSSSLLEDSYRQPMAGIYATYMLANNHPDDSVRLARLARVIKLVYASTFLENPRKYLESVNMRIEEEKMGILLQEVVGARFGSASIRIFRASPNRTIIIPQATSSPRTASRTSRWDSAKPLL